MSLLETKARHRRFDIGSSGACTPASRGRRDDAAPVHRPLMSQRLCCPRRTSSLGLCMLRYSGEPFFGEVDDDHSAVVPGGVQSAARSVQFDNEVAGVVR
ncbi:hypothetical protein ZWY2020_001788 [Hordeum vulgare]|nr:hypothetical protein ZWY2020_001788 [Hordeum vulgare]